MTINTMLFFKCKISFNELVAIEKNIPDDSYCISREPFDDFHYGVIRNSSFNELLNTLSGETLEQLEYLSEDEFRSVVRQRAHLHSAFTGDNSLLKE